MVAASLLDLIGNTPLVELRQLSPAGPHASTRSSRARTRPARSRTASRSRWSTRPTLEPGQELLEPTSGNTGISLALVAKLRGYKLTCVMPANATPERRLLLELYGATIVDSPGRTRARTAPSRLAQEIAARDDRYVMLFQYANEANPRAHYEGTGAEIVRDLPRVDALVAGLGTGGTLMGTGARVREAYPDVIVVAAEPLPGDPVMGLRSLEDGYVPPILDVSQLDRKLLVSNAESVAAVRVAARPRRASSPASRRAPSSTSRGGSPTSCPGRSTVVAMLADGGWKYLSADFWRADARRSMEAALWW